MSPDVIEQAAPRVFNPTAQDPYGRDAFTQASQVAWGRVARWP
ncbi:MAG TPA: hypothetical protein VLI46_01205 [Ramlibacter sp.]|nr:hypothetical protein [Ramlibacter sp.]